MESLDKLYFEYESLYEDTTTISVNTYETTFGSIKISTAGAASTAEVVAYLLQELGAEFTSDIATNLILGIESATDKLQSLAATADTFEIVSKLLRAGGRRLSRAKVHAPQNHGFAQAVSRASKGDQRAETPKEQPKKDQPKEAKAEPREIHHVRKLE